MVRSISERRGGARRHHFRRRRRRPRAAAAAAEAPLLLAAPSAQPSAPPTNHRLEEPLLRTPAQPRQQAAYGSGRGKQQAGDSPDPEAAVVPSPAAGWRLATEVFEEPPVQYKQSSLWDTT